MKSTKEICQPSDSALDAMTMLAEAPINVPLPSSTISQPSSRTSQPSSSISQPSSRISGTSSKVPSPPKHEPKAEGSIKVY
jgi:hypothetical protein